MINDVTEKGRILALRALCLPVGPHRTSPPKPSEQSPILGHHIKTITAMLTMMIAITITFTTIAVLLTATIITTIYFIIITIVFIFQRPIR